MVAEAVKTFGAIHYAINKCWCQRKPRLPTHELDVEAFDRTQNINLRGLWLCEREELRQMLKQKPELKLR
jgi:NAD(P)-dependent dehydrogenase (short-subunit alcohol dehydrogenase family)